VSAAWPTAFTAIQGQNDLKKNCKVLTHFRQQTAFTCLNLMLLLADVDLKQVQFNLNGLQLITQTFLTFYALQ
jgi:hypothetical protein